MSIQSNFPAISPSLLLDFAAVQQLDPRITFTRASTATYYGTQTAKAEENLLLQSQDFTTTWANTGTTDTANTSVAPDGTTTADTLTENASGSGQASISQTLNFIAGLPYTLSFFVKQGTQTFAQLLFGSGAFGVNAYANFNVTTGAGAVGTVGSSTTASIVDAGNGWYRCIITATATTTTSVSAQLNIIESATDARAPSITLNSGTILLWGAQLEQRSAVTAYTVTTTQTITNYIPQLLTAASGVARFDHNPTTFESLGLLIEESRTNLVTYSEQFDNAAWTTTSAAVTPNATTAPDGNVTVDLITYSSAVANPARNISVTSGTTYTVSVYAKTGNVNFARFRIGASSGGSGTSASVFFNLSTGVVSSTPAPTADFTTFTTSINQVGNDFYRLSFTFLVTNGVTSLNLAIVASATSGGSAASGNTFYIWGAQLEVGAFATSYIPTVASQVTRAADVAVMTGTNFSSWYNAAQGSLYAEWSSVGSLSDNRIPYAISDGTFNNVNYLTAATASASNQSVNTIRSSNTTQANMAVSVAYTNYAYRKTAAAYKVNDFALSGDGGAVAVDTSGSVPIGIDRLSLGTSWTANSNFLNGTIRKIAYYPLRVTNAQLQALTS